MSFTGYQSLQRIAYKLVVITHNCLRGLGPQYLLDMLQQIAEIPHRQYPRSAQHGDLAVAKLRTSCLGARSFSQSSAVVWNSLPPALRCPDLSIELFRKNLKTYLFMLAYGH